MIKKSNLTAARLALLAAKAEHTSLADGRPDLVQAANAEMISARANGDVVMTLGDRCWPEDAIIQAGKSGNWLPPGLAQRVVQAKTMKVAPSFRDLLRFDLEDLIVSGVLSDAEQKQVEKTLAFVTPRKFPPSSKSRRSAGALLK